MHTIFATGHLKQPTINAVMKKLNDVPYMSIKKVTQFVPMLFISHQINRQVQSCQSELDRKITNNGGGVKKLGVKIMLIISYNDNTLH